MQVNDPIMGYFVDRSHFKKRKNAAVSSFHTDSDCYFNSIAVLCSKPFRLAAYGLRCGNIYVAWGMIYTASRCSVLESAECYDS